MTLAKGECLPRKNMKERFELEGVSKVQLVLNLKLLTFVSFYSQINV